MTAGLSRALWAALVLLAGLVAYEWTGGATPVTVTAPRPHAAVQPQEAEARETAVWSAAILQRPLFSSSRKPLKAARLAGAPGMAAMPRLAGIMITPQGRRAIFASTGSAKPLVLAEGASVNDIVIRAIQPDRVILASGATVLLSYDKNRVPGVGGTQPFVPISPAFQQPGFQQPGFQNPAFQQPGFQPPGVPGAYPAPGYQPGFQAPAFQPPAFQPQQPQAAANQSEAGDQDAAPPQPPIQPGFRPILPTPRRP